MANIRSTIKCRVVEVVKLVTPCVAGAATLDEEDEIAKAAARRIEELESDFIGLGGSYQAIQNAKQRLISILLG